MNETLRFATITLSYPDGREETFSLKENQTLKIGRDTGSDIQVDDSAVSRIHASITASTSGIFLADHASLNGTFVNSEKISTMRIVEPNDLVNIGPVKIKVDIHGLEGLSSTNPDAKARAMTAQLKPCSVTLLIASVPNYLEIAKEVPATDAANMLASWSQGVSKIISEHGGEFDKFVNSSVVARWNEDEQKSAEAALSAAKVIKEFTKTMANSDWSYQKEQPWSARMILNSGQGLIGSIGGASNQGFSVLGDPVNATFKLAEETQSSEHKIILSKSIVESLDEQEATQVIKNTEDKAFYLV